MIEGLLSLFYPRLCVACNRTLLKNEEHLCSTCLFMLPVLKIENSGEGPVMNTFRGKIPLEWGGAFLRFKQGNITQKILHHAKYGNNPELCFFLGTLFGNELIKTGFNADHVVAVPLHLSKQKKRGYNQSERFAAGLSGITGIPNSSYYLQRKKATDTQTRKMRFERWENVADIFEVNPTYELNGQHILLVDDVITTGSTIEACALTLLKHFNCRISVGSIAITFN